MNTYKVRCLHSADRDAWLTMWQEYMDFYQSSLPPEVVEHTLQTLLSDDKNTGCLIACNSQNVPVGFLTFIIHLSTWSIAPECYLHDLYVKAEHRKAGVAKMLMDELKQMAKQHQWNNVYWMTKPDNFIAQTLYNKMGKGEPWIIYIMSKPD